MEQKRIGEASPEELLTLKGKYGKVKMVEVEDEDTIYYIYLKRPDFATLKAVTKVAKTDELRVRRSSCRTVWSLGLKKSSRTVSYSWHLLRLPPHS